MAYIGCFGDVVFAVNGWKELTFDKFRLQQSVKTAVHEVGSWKGRLEVTGEELDKVTMGIRLVAGHGVRPRYQLKRLWRMMHLKEAYFLVVGNMRVMDRRCVITEISSDWQNVYRGGAVSMIDCEVTFMEYN